MYEVWIVETEQLLKKIGELTSKKERDRLEIVNSMLFVLHLLERSLYGWWIWIEDLDLMSQFSIDELNEMEDTLKRQVKIFLEYDIKVTKRWMDKIPQMSQYFRNGKQDIQDMYI